MLVSSAFVFVQNLHTKVVDAMGGDKVVKAAARKKVPSGGRKCKRDQWIEVRRRYVVFE